MDAASRMRLLYTLSVTVALLQAPFAAALADEKQFFMSQPLSSPIPESLYPVLAVTLISSGLIATATFFVYEVTVSRFTRSIVYEGVIGGMASILLGFGTLFLFLWTGVYV